MRAYFQDAFNLVDGQNVPCRRCQGVSRGVVIGHHIKVVGTVEELQKGVDILERGGEQDGEGEEDDWLVATPAGFTAEKSP